MKILGYEYQSCFAPYIKQFLQEKRSVGFSYETEEWKLKHFDDFCVKESVIQPYLSRELVKKGGHCVKEKHYLPVQHVLLSSVSLRYS